MLNDPKRNVSHSTFQQLRFHHRFHKLTQILTQIICDLFVIISVHLW